jgi:hypothetical protein
MRRYEYAEAAYNAYCQWRHWRSLRGEPLPKFAKQSKELRDAWAAAADSVRALQLRRILQSHDPRGGK